MEVLFAPTTRFRDLYHARERYDDDDDDDHQEQLDDLVEVELITGSSAEDIFLHCGFSWSDFSSFGSGKKVWISPDVFFDFALIDNMKFQTDYQSFLTVQFDEANEEGKLRVKNRSKT
jgi:hypothetical protein